MTKHQIHKMDGEWTIWIKPAEGFRFSCCDCGLVHAMEFALDSTEAIIFRVRRHNRATASVRAARKKKASNP